MSAGWAAFGAGLFLVALMTPISLINFEILNAPAREEALARAPAALAAASVRRTERDALAATSLTERLGEGHIVPGERIGTVRIGMPIDDLIASIEEAPVLHFEMVDGRLVRHQRFVLDNVEVAMQSDPKIGRVDAVALSAIDCADLRTFQPRQNGLPATPDGLSLGSHYSRVQMRLGIDDVAEPVAGAVNVPRIQEFPGLKVAYCGEDMLVGALSVERLPGGLADTVPMIAQSAPPQLAFGERAFTVTDPLSHMRPGAPLPLTLPPAGRFAKATAPDRAAAPAVPAMHPVQIPGALALGDAAVPEGTVPDIHLAADRAPHDGAPWRALAGLSAPVADETALLIASAAAEDGLGLALRDRRQVQIRLALLGYDTSGIDGIFGPKTREAIAAMQETEQLPANGYVTPETLAVLEGLTETKYARLLATQRRAREAAQTQPVAAARVPEARNATNCKRDASGTVIENQSFRCDVAVLTESLRALFGGKS